MKTSILSPLTIIMNISIFFYTSTYLVLEDSVMNIKNFLNHFLWTLLAIFLTLFFISTLYYFNIISSNITNYLRPLSILLILFISSYKLGKKIEKNGYLEGCKLGSSTILFFLIISLIFFRSYFKFRIILYYFILIITSILGSMIGINKEKK